MPLIEKDQLLIIGNLETKVFSAAIAQNTISIPHEKINVIVHTKCSSKNTFAQQGSAPITLYYNSVFAFGPIAAFAPTNPEMLKVHDHLQNGWLDTCTLPGNVEGWSYGMNIVPPSASAGLVVQSGTFGGSPGSFEVTMAELQEWATRKCAICTDFFDYNVNRSENSTFSYSTQGLKPGDITTDGANRRLIPTLNLLSHEWLPKDARDGFERENLIALWKMGAQIHVLISLLDAVPGLESYHPLFAKTSREFSLHLGTRIIALSLEAGLRAQMAKTQLEAKLDPGIQNTIKAAKLALSQEAQSKAMTSFVSRGSTTGGHPRGGGTGGRGKGAN